MRMRSLAAGAAALSTAATVAVLGASPAGASAPVRAASTPMCATSQLTAALSGGDAGAGNLYQYLLLTNHSTTTCHVTGFPGLSMLDAKGKQIGAPATREHSGYAPVVLRPGASASDTVHTINHQGTCLPTSAKLRIYPPGNKAALVFAGQVTDCHNQFSVTPFTAGKSGNPPGSAPAVPATTAPSGSGQQVSAVPQGAPNTGLAATSSSGSNGATAVLAGAGVLAVGGAGVALGLRRRSRTQG